MEYRGLSLDDLSLRVVIDVVIWIVHIKDRVLQRGASAEPSHEHVVIVVTDVQDDLFACCELGKELSRILAEPLPEKA